MTLNSRSALANGVRLSQGNRPIRGEGAVCPQTAAGLKVTNEARRSAFTATEPELPRSSTLTAGRRPTVFLLSSEHVPLSTALPLTPGPEEALISALAA